MITAQVNKAGLFGKQQKCWPMKYAKKGDFIIQEFCEHNESGYGYASLSMCVRKNSKQPTIITEVL